MNLFLLSGTHHSPTFLYAAWLLAFVGIFFVSWITSYPSINSSIVGFVVSGYMYFGSQAIIRFGFLQSAHLLCGLMSRAIVPIYPRSLLLYFGTYIIPFALFQYFPHIRRGISSGQNLMNFPSPFNALSFFFYSHWFITDSMFLSSKPISRNLVAFIGAVFRLMSNEWYIFCCIVACADYCLGLLHLWSQAILFVYFVTCLIRLWYGVRLSVHHTSGLMRRAIVRLFPPSLLLYFWHLPYPIVMWHITSPSVAWLFCVLLAFTLDLMFIFDHCILLLTWWRLLLISPLCEW